MPRVKDKNNKVHTIQVPWARSGSGFTLLFEAYSMLLMEQDASEQSSTDSKSTAPVCGEYLIIG
ncbi:MAG: transposase family protein [Bacteroidales bacterium]|nr:transposase family protein [Bacteroidales bacterium]